MNIETKNAIIIKPSKLKIIFIPTGIISLSMYSLGLLAIASGVNKVGVSGVIQSFKNNPDVFYSILLPLLGFLSLQILYRLILSREKIEIQEKTFTFHRLFSNKTVQNADVLRLTKHIHYLSFSTKITIHFTEGKTKTVDVSLYKQKDVSAVLHALVSP